MKTKAHHHTIPWATFLSILALFLCLLPFRASAASDGVDPNNLTKPTIVLVHGAFAGTSSWDGVTKLLLGKGYHVVAVANPLRGLRSDSEYLATLLKSIQGPIVLAGHSYGGCVISNAAENNSSVKALVFVAAVAPDEGESLVGLTGRFPGSTLVATLAPVSLPGGNKDLYVQQDKFPAQFAADLPEAEAKLLAVTQRPVTGSALNEPSGPTAWKTIPSWFIFGSLDKTIPEAAHKFMAERAKAKQTVDVDGASHLVMISHAEEVADLIDKAASSSTP